MLENAVRICEAKFGSFVYREGDAFRMGAMHGAPPHTPTDDSAIRLSTWPRNAPWTASSARSRRSKLPIQIEAMPTLDGSRLDRYRAELGGARTILAVPMLKDDELIGAIVIYRQEVGHSPKSRSNWSELRRPGRHRHREHAPAQRAAPAHRRSLRVAGAADRDLRGAQGHRSSPGELAAGVRRHTGERDRPVRRQIWQLAAQRGRRVPNGQPV